MDSSRPSDVDKEAKSDMKDAVSFLLKGGSLLSAPCAICKGVQIKYKNEIICINLEPSTKSELRKTNFTINHHFHLIPLKTRSKKG